jgi:hypothetical protein
MTFILGSVLFLLGGFFGMLIMSFMFAVNSNMKRLKEDQDFKKLMQR